jgi:ferredoxin-NADP reductase
MQHDPRLPADAIEVCIGEIEDIAPAVKRFRLDYGAQRFAFLPGQWIDLYAEVGGILSVGGYSMISAPDDSGSFELAIKAALHHPVTRWLHEQARVGDRLFVSQGQGSFFYRPGMAQELVLLGAGIGVTPLLSILRTLAREEPPTPSTLLYSATHSDELLFRPELEAIAATHPGIRCRFTVTGEDPAWEGERGRIDVERIQTLGASPEALYFYCGSREFIEAMDAALDTLGIEPAQRVVERWW